MTWEGVAAILRVNQMFVKLNMGWLKWGKTWGYTENQNENNKVVRWNNNSRFPPEYIDETEMKSKLWKKVHRWSQL